MASPHRNLLLIIVILAIFGSLVYIFNMTPTTTSLTKTTTTTTTVVPSVKAQGSWTLNAANAGGMKSGDNIVPANFWTPVISGGVTLTGTTAATFTLPNIGQYLINYNLSLKSNVGAFQRIALSDGTSFYNNVPSVSNGLSNLCMSVVVSVKKTNTTFTLLFNPGNSTEIDTANPSNTISVIQLS